MRTVLIAAVAAAGIGIAGLATGLAAPLNGLAISKAAEAGAVVDQVHWYRFRHHHHHFYYHHRHHHRWWW